MPTLQQLRYLVALADTGHHRRAAERCNVAQPTLSVQLRDLERRLGTPLLERNRRQVILTPAGQEITAHARRALAEVEEIRQIAARGRAGLAGTVRVGVVHTLGAYLLPLAIPDLRQAFPDLGFYIREDLLEALSQQLEAGQHELLLCPLPLPRAEIETLPLFHEPLMAVLPRDHRLAASAHIATQDLAGERVLTLERGHSLHDQVIRFCGEAGAEVSRDYEGTSLDTLRQMVAMRMGISLLPALYVRSEVQREQMVVARPLAGKGLWRTVGLAWRRGSHRDTAFRDLGRRLRVIATAAAPELVPVAGRADR